MQILRQSWASGALLTVLGLTGCDKKATNGPRLEYTGPLMETTNVRTLYSDSAKLKLQLTAPLEQRFENSDVRYPKGVEVKFYSADNTKKVVNTLTANYGKLDKAKNLYIMRGDVRVVNVPQEQRLNTEELFFDMNKQLIYTDSAMFVKVTTPQEYLTGYGLRANQDFSRYSIINPKGVFAVPQSAPAP
ncbi:LPS export ABC transporter periplasmic protein LptC [Hymenobacter sp. B1770]|uniref:LPS export ABC transporter periplasmic protein LptC n=1 Tax=Hymenobacter sp. B1770 TaxID=1718788 RepID=UPI003CF889C6